MKIICANVRNVDFIFPNAHISIHASTQACKQAIKQQTNQASFLEDMHAHTQERSLVTKTYKLFLMQRCEQIIKMCGQGVWSWCVVKACSQDVCLSHVVKICGQGVWS